MIARRLIPLIVLVIVAAGGWWGYSRFYSGPMRALGEDIDRYETAIGRLEMQLEEGQPAVRARLRSIVATTLGTQPDEVDHQFRSMLNRIAAEEGLADITVGTGRPRGVGNPAGRGGIRDARFRGMVREGTDFYEIDGDLKGVGTLEQVLRVEARVRAQPWVHRVGAVTIRPVGNKRRRFELGVSLSTVMLADVGVEAHDPEPSPAPTESLSRIARVTARNVFAPPAEQVAEDPAPPPVVAEDPPPQPAPTPPPPYGDWRVTGVVQTPVGVEVWLTNTPTGSSVVLNVGQSVLDAVLESGLGERAVFRIGQDRFEVDIGQTLAARRGVSG